MSKLWRDLSRFCSDRSGTIAVLTALSLTALVGFAGLGIETTQWYTEKRSIQAASDDAALSAAIAFAKGNTSGYTTEAKSVAGSDGFVDGTNQVSVTVNMPPLSGPYASNASAVQVIITAPAQPVLSRMFISDFTIGGQGVAIVSPAGTAAGGCVLALNGAAAGAGTLSGTTSITLNKCSFIVDSTSNSALIMNGNSSLTASNIILGGMDSISNNATITGGVIEHAGNVADPYAGRTIPTPAATCLTIPNKATTLSPGTYCSLSVNANQTLALSPGVYIIDGGNVDIAGGGTLTGTGVTIVLTSSVSPLNDTGNIIINGGAIVTLTAPTTGATAGIVFWQDGRAVDSGRDKMLGGSTMNITGAIYLPSESVTYSGGNTSGNGGGCTQIVASIITFTGNSEFDNNCSGTGVTTIPSSSTLATLAQ